MSMRATPRLPRGPSRCLLGSWLTQAGFCRVGVAPPRCYRGAAEVLDVSYSIQLLPALAYDSAVYPTAPSTLLDARASVARASTFWQAKEDLVGGVNHKYKLYGS